MEHDFYCNVQLESTVSIVFACEKSQVSPASSSKTAALAVLDAIPNGVDKANFVYSSVRISSDEVIIQEAGVLILLKVTLRMALRITF